MINPLAFMLTYAIFAWCSKGGVSRKVCFKEPKGEIKANSCRFPIQHSHNQSHAKDDSFDCCSLPGAMYYANTSYTLDQIRFIGVDCSPCRKTSGLGVSRKVCFKEHEGDDKGNNCRFPIENSHNQSHAKAGNSFDCCSLPDAMYYANTSYTLDQIGFIGVDCSPCKKKPGPGNPCEGIVCDSGKVCVGRNGKGKCICSHCNGVAHQPVCGTDGLEYANECELKRHACQERRTNVEVAYDGTCKIGCDSVVCRKNRTCMVDQYKKAYCVSCVDCSKHPKKGDPVCGADGVQYENSCHLRMETCRQGKTIGLAYRGKCIANATCSNINCDTGHRRLERQRNKQCVKDTTGRPRCVTCSCEDSEKMPASSSVCGTDNRTYDDHCSLREHMCTTKAFIDVKHLGPCTGDLYRNPPKDESCPPVPEKSCDYEDLGMYYITLKQFVGILRNDFGLHVIRPRYKKLIPRDKVVPMRQLIAKLSKRFRKIRKETP